MPSVRGCVLIVVLVLLASGLGVGALAIANGALEPLKPLESVTFTTIDQYATGRHVTLIGDLSLRDSITCYNNGKHCIAELVDAADTTVGPGHPRRMFIYFDPSDLVVGPKVHLTSGGSVETGAVVRVTGRVCRTLDEPPKTCVFVDQVELAGGPIAGASPRTSPATPETTSAAEPTLTPLAESSAAPTAEPSADSLPIELRKAIKTGLVTAKGTGDGLQRLDLEVTSKSDQELTIVVESGTVLAPKASATQTMVVITEAVLVLTQGSTDSVSLNVACAQMREDEPTEEDTFKVQMLGPKADLLKLLRLPQFASEDFRVQQFAIWTITDNPSRGGYMGISAWYLAFGTGPSSDEMTQIKSLFKAAKIATGHYRAFG